jgi:hypothetical protein
MEANHHHQDEDKNQRRAGQITKDSRDEHAAQLAGSIQLSTCIHHVLLV